MPNALACGVRECFSHGFEQRVNTAAFTRMKPDHFLTFGESNLALAHPFALSCSRMLEGECTTPLFSHPVRRALCQRTAVSTSIQSFVFSSPVSPTHSNPLEPYPMLPNPIDLHPSRFDESWFHAHSLDIRSVVTPPKFMECRPSQASLANPIQFNPIQAS